MPKSFIRSSSHPFILSLAIALLSLTACGDGNDPVYGDSSEGALVGKFTVDASGRQVCFSRGNLQYQASTKIWRFAEHQYDFIGLDNENISDSYEGWIDLFGWGTGNNPTLDESETFNSFVDWGVNPISNGGSQPNQWRTLTADEWIYIIFGRIKDNRIDLAGLGSVNGINGFILLPDDWDYTGVPFVSISKSNNIAWDPDNNVYYDPKGGMFANNRYTVAQWQQMEAHGAVFFPCAGFRSNGEPRITMGFGRYWTKTPDNANTEKAYGVECFEREWRVKPMWRCMGQSVRLVQEVQ